MQTWRLSSTVFWSTWIVIVCLAAILRLWHLNSLPPSLYWEEAALGYDAYSILQTGKDHHGHSWPLTAFESFGDWKPSLYFYTLVPSIAIFGLNEWAVRMPSALAGIILVIEIGFLAKIVAEEQITFWQHYTRRHHLSNEGRVAQLLAMAIAGLSPWAIQFSRGAWEVNLATMLFLSGVLLALEIIRRDLPNMPGQGAHPGTVFFFGLAASLSFAGSMYAYHATRVLVPLMSSGFLTVWLNYQHTLNNATLRSDIWNNLKKNWWSFLLSWSIAACFLIPLTLALGTPQLQQRFQETSIFGVSHWVTDSNHYRELAEFSWWSRLFYHRYWFLAGDVAKNFFTHLRVDYLFLNGDKNLRHSTQLFGIFYPFEIIFLSAGIYECVRRRKVLHLFLLYWIVVGLLPASITTAVPHALRTLPTMPAYITTITIGIITIGQWLAVHSEEAMKATHLKVLSSQQLVLVYAGTVVLLYAAGFSAFWFTYTRLYPVVSAADWQGGYKEAIQAVETNRQPNEPIFFSREQGRPAMYYWFYTKTNPTLVQAEDTTAPKDQGEFLAFQNVTFTSSPDQIKTGLVVSSPALFDQVKARFQTTELQRIRNTAGQEVWVVYRTQ